MSTRIEASFGASREGGLRRLFDEGVWFTHAEHAHARTYTAPGHASLATGTYPRAHGVITNDWLVPDTGVRVSPVERDDVRVLGAPSGRRGAPDGLERTTVGDWLRAVSPESTVVSIASKDRASILMGGKQPTLAVWFEPVHGRWVTSTH